MFPVTQATKNSNLGVGCFAYIATVLMANAHAFVALFHPAAFIDQQPGQGLFWQRLRNILCHLIHHRTRVPIGIADKMVHRVVIRIERLAYPFNVV